MNEVKYTISQPPITKKNSQQILMNRSTGRPFIMPSKQYKQYEKLAAWYLRPKPTRPIDCRCNVECVFYMPTRRKTDLTNLLEAACDVLVTAGIMADDNYTIIASHDGSRCEYDKSNPRTEITITKLPEDEEQTELPQPSGQERG